MPTSNFIVERRKDTTGTVALATSNAFKALKQKHEFQGTLGFHNQHQDKDVRISTLEPAIKNGWLAFNEIGLPGEFWKQLRQFPSADHNDAPDAVQGACRARITTTVRQRETEDWKRENWSRIVHL